MESKTQKRWNKSAHKYWVRRVLINKSKKPKKQRIKKEGLPRCPKCNAELKLQYSKKYQKQYYYCPRKCDIFIAAHPNGSPVGTPVVREIRELRCYAHILADKIWKYKIPAERHQMYAWLKKHSLSGHFGMMGEEELVNTIDRLQKIIKRFKQ